MNQAVVSPGHGFSSSGFSIIRRPDWVCSSTHISTMASFRIHVSCSNLRASDAPDAKFSNRRGVADSKAENSRRITKKVKDNERHLWKKRDSAGSGKKALNLVRIVSELPNEKEAVYGALDKWTAWETEFPVIAAAKALQILRKKAQWQRVIQVAKWMLSKGQGDTMATYDTLLLAFDMEGRVDEAEALWRMVLHIHHRSISKRLFARMVFLYDHHDIPNGIVEVFADMEELGVRPDEDTVRKVARAFKILGQKEKATLALQRYLSDWKYVHFNGERVRVRRNKWVDE